MNQYVQIQFVFIIKIYIIIIPILKKYILYKNI